jgi:hypothetical protein
MLKYIEAVISTFSKTLEQFVERMRQLYEQERGKF